MGTTLIDNFDYKGKRFLDGRQSVATLAALKAMPETQLPDGFRAYCQEDKQWYEYNSRNTPDATAGKWRPAETSTIYDVSTKHPTGGIDGSDRYTDLISARATAGHSDTHVDNIKILSFKDPDGIRQFYLFTSYGVVDWSKPSCWMHLNSHVVELEWKGSIGGTVAEIAVPDRKSGMIVSFHEPGYGRRILVYTGEDSRSSNSGLTDCFMHLCPESRLFEYLGIIQQSTLSGPVDQTPIFKEFYLENAPDIDQKFIINYLSRAEGYSDGLVMIKESGGSSGSVFSGTVGGLDGSPVKIDAMGGTFVAYAIIDWSRVPEGTFKRVSLEILPEAKQLSHSPGIASWLQSKEM